MKHVCELHDIMEKHGLCRWKNMRKLRRTEMRILRLMCAVRLQNRLTNADLQIRFGIECTGDVVRSSMLRWFGHVERKPEEDWVNKIVTFEVEGK